MPLKTVERDSWRASIQFKKNENSSSVPKVAELTSLLTGLQALLPASEECPTELSFPGLLGQAGQFEFQLSRKGEIIRQPIAMGRNALGWVFELSDQVMHIRHQQHVYGVTWGAMDHPKKGERVVVPEAFPSPEVFSERVLAGLDLLLTSWKDCIYRVSLHTSYASLLGDVHPGSWISTRFGGKEAPVPLPNGVEAVYEHKSLCYEEMSGRRNVWNNTVSVGSWFEEESKKHKNGIAVVFGVELKTALDLMHDIDDESKAEHETIPLNEVRDFFSAKKGSPFTLMLDRSKKNWAGARLVGGRDV